MHQRDRRTDTERQQRSRLRIASRGKNYRHDRVKVSTAGARATVPEIHQSPTELTSLGFPLLVQLRWFIARAASPPGSAIFTRTVAKHCAGELRWCTAAIYRPDLPRCELVPTWRDHCRSEVLDTWVVLSRCLETIFSKSVLSVENFSFYYCCGCSS